MESVFGEKIDFDNNDSVSFPIDILNKICKKANDELRGLVNISVNEYLNPIVSYERPSLANALSGMMGPAHVDIQDDLGELGDYYSKYDVVFQSDYLKNYKFRLMFVGCGIAGYPAKIVLEKGVAEDISKDSKENYIINIKNEKDFENYVEAIFNSAAVVKIIQDIVNATKRKMSILSEDNTDE